MNKQFTILVVALCAALSAGLAAADTRIERNGKVYRVADNATAAVCKSILRDQPGNLRGALYHGIAPIERSRAHTYYACNDMNLLSFAREVEAHKVVAYLAPRFDKGVTTTEEVAAR